METEDKARTQKNSLLLNEKALLRLYLIVSVSVLKVLQITYLNVCTSVLEILGY